MTKKNTENPLYAHDTLEFVTVAAQFCAYLEQSQERTKTEFVETMLKLLPLLYMKATMVPRIESFGDFLPSDQVSEDDYNCIRFNVAQIMGEDDEYEELARGSDVQFEDVRWQTVSEGIADIYQPLRNFVFAYQQRLDDCMTDALWAVMDQFELFWGQCVLDTLRQLHTVRYSQTNADDEDDL